MRVYVASSWRNDWQPDIVNRLREDGHSVYDFRNPEPGNSGFAWSSIDPNWQQWTWEQYREALKHPLAAKGFDLDMTALREAEATVLVMPCGRSAHLELGYAIGAGQRTAIILGDEQEPELMYLMADLVTGSPEQVCTFLRKHEKPPAKTEGWLGLTGSRKFHYIGPDGRSLCGKWHCLDPKPEWGTGPWGQHVEGDCAACARAVTKRAAA